VDPRAGQFGERHDQVVGDAPKFDGPGRDTEPEQRQRRGDRRHRHVLRPARRSGYLTTMPWQTPASFRSDAHEVVTMRRLDKRVTPTIPVEI